MNDRNRFGTAKAALATIPFVHGVRRAFATRDGALSESFLAVEDQRTGAIRYTRYVNDPSRQTWAKPLFTERNIVVEPRGLWWVASEAVAS